MAHLIRQAPSAITPGQDGLVPGWIFLTIFRFFVGVGNAGLIAVDIPLVQEFVPSHKRGWVSGLTTTLLPAGNLMGAVSGAFLAPIIGWRGLFLVGLVPAVLVLMIRYWVPESPRWLMRVGRHEEARKSLAWALQCDPREIELPSAPVEVERTAWRELFRISRSGTDRPRWCSGSRRSKPRAARSRRSAARSTPPRRERLQARPQFSFWCGRQSGRSYASMSLDLTSSESRSRRP
jgi:MFS family permease